MDISNALYDISGKGIAECDTKIRFQSARWVPIIWGYQLAIGVPNSFTQKVLCMSRHTVATRQKSISISQSYDTNQHNKHTLVTGLCVFGRKESSNLWFFATWKWWLAVLAGSNKAIPVRGVQTFTQSGFARCWQVEVSDMAILKQLGPSAVCRL